MQKIPRKKSLSQNFLTDVSILDRIVGVAAVNGLQDKNVLEIGVGEGALTAAILKQKPKKLLSVEIDNRYYGLVKDKFNGYSNFEIINADAIKIDESTFFNDKISVIANLPYNVGTTLLLKWLKNIELFETFTLLLQKEVVERIIAKPCTKEYGRLSVLAQAFTYPHRCFDIKPACFTPPPKVMSSVVHLIAKPPVIDFNKLSRITSALFNNRRKKIKPAIERLNLPTNLKIDINKRAEELSVDEFIEIAKL